MPSTSTLDPAASYDCMLEQGIRLSGEDRHFFIRGRLKDLRRALPAGFSPRSVLDFGCGVGDTTRQLAEMYPQAAVVGTDTAADALACAVDRCGGDRVRFVPFEALAGVPAFDLCYVNGVFHHILPADRPRVLAAVHRALAPGAWFALFENNPWNPGTRMVMRRIPFDRDARPLSHRAAKRMLAGAGFERAARTRFLFFFPRRLAFLRVAEPRLRRLPLGAQYLCLARKPSPSPAPPNSPRIKSGTGSREKGSKGWRNIIRVTLLRPAR